MSRRGIGVLSSFIRNKPSHVGVRCVQLVWSYDDDNPTAWAELVNKVKDGVLSAFDATVTQREEEVKRSESQRTMPGWNFCTFFILKVGWSIVATPVLILILDGLNPYSGKPCQLL